MSDGGYNVLLPFDSDEEEFCRGFEAGHIWTTMRVCERDGHLLCAEEDGYAMTAHAVNAEMLLRIAERTGHTVKTEDADETWLHATFREVS